MNTAELVRRMSAAGATPEAIAIAMEAINEVAADGRARAAERQRRYRERQRDVVTLHRHALRDSVTPTTTASANGHAAAATGSENESGGSVTLEKQVFLSSSSFSVDSSEIQQRKEEQVEGRAKNASPLFDRFWAAFPNKVGKEAARKAFAKVVGKRVDIDEMLRALARYAAKTDDRPWCNPATWLNQHRWEDQPAIGPPRVNGGRLQPNTAKERHFNAVERLWPGPGSDGHGRNAPNGSEIPGLLSDRRPSRP